MPLINRPPAAATKKTVTIRMPVDIIDSLHDYARFLGSTLDHVVIEALKLVFKKDAEFKAWQVHQQPSPAKGSAAPEPSKAAFSLLFFRMQA